MKQYMMMAVICGCLLIGSLYPRLLLEHHAKLVDEYGKEIVLEEYSEEIPIRLSHASLARYLKRKFPPYLLRRRNASLFANTTRIVR